MSTETLNLTVLLKHFDLRNLYIYEVNRDDQAARKELDRLVQYVLPVWISGASNGPEQAAILIAFNEHINVGWSSLAGHPELQTKLLAAIGLGRKVNHDFQYRYRKPASTKLGDFLRRKYPDARDEEVALWCDLNNEATLIALCEAYGVQTADRGAIVNEYRKQIE